MSLDCPGTVATVASGVAAGAPECLDGSGLPLQWQAVPPFDVSQLDTPTLAGCFAIGFTIIGTCWFIGRAVGMVLKSVKSL